MISGDYAAHQDFDKHLAGNSFISEFKELILTGQFETDFIKSQHLVFRGELQQFMRLNVVRLSNT